LQSSHFAQLKVSDESKIDGTIILQDEVIMLADTTQYMQCMEVWGGNQHVDSGVVMAGLDAWVFSRPYGNSTGGGDVYYVSSCATGRITRLLVADVSGHGDVVAGTAASLRGLMRRFVNHLDQKQFVKSMNGQFVALSDVGCFATAVVTTFFAPTNELSLCNAGHPPPLVYRASRKAWEFLDGTDKDGVNIPFGIDDIDEYGQFSVRLRVNDLVLCYTDSLVEARLKGTSDLLGKEGLLKIVQTLDPTKPEMFTASLLAAIDQQLPGSLDADDVTVLLFRPNGLAKKAPFVTRLMAPIRLMGAIIARPFSGQPIPWPDFSLPNVGGMFLSRFEKTDRKH